MIITEARVEAERRSIFDALVKAFWSDRVYFYDEEPHNLIQPAVAAQLWLAAYGWVESEYE